VVYCIFEEEMMIDGTKIGSHIVSAVIFGDSVKSVWLPDETSIFRAELSRDYASTELVNSGETVELCSHVNIWGNYRADSLTQQPRLLFASLLQVWNFQLLILYLESLNSAWKNGRTSRTAVNITSFTPSTQWLASPAMLRYAHAVKL